MLAVAFSEPWTANGLGELTRGTGKDFDCTTAICFGRGPANDPSSVHQLFVRLQQHINVVGQALISGFRPILVDGFIGTGTVTVLRTVAAVAKSVIGTSFLDTVANGTVGTKEAVARDADTIEDLLALVVERVQKQRAVEGKPAIVVTSAVAFRPPTTAVPASTSTFVPASAPGVVPTAKPRTLWFVIGGVAAAVAIGAAGFAVVRRRRTRAR